MLRLGLTTVIIAACFAAACRSTPADTPSPVSTNAWAVVDGREITRDEVDKTFRRLGDAPQELSAEETLAAKLNLLEDLITQQILLAKAGELKVEVPETEVDAAFAEAKKNIPDEAFRQELTKRNLTEADMRDGLRRELLAQKVIEREVTSKIVVPDQEIIDFFNANRSRFDLKEDSYHLAQIVVTPAREPQVTNRTGDDAATPQAAAAKIQMLMERLKGGAPFGDLARDFSEDPDSAPRGGDLGLVPMSALNQAPPSLRDAVLKGTPGNARVVTQGGVITIVYLVSRETAGQRDLSTPGVRDQIMTALRQRREQLLRAAYLTSIRTDADVTNYLARQVVQSQGKPPAP